MKSSSRLVIPKILPRTKEEPFVLKAEYVKDLREAECSSLEVCSGTRLFLQILNDRVSWFRNSIPQFSVLNPVLLTHSSLPRQAGEQNWRHKILTTWNTTRKDPCPLSMMWGDTEQPQGPSHAPPCYCKHSPYSILARTRTQGVMNQVQTVMFIHSWDKYTTHPWA